jgi:nucleotide-binding universal stress UspA family protein
MLKSFLNVVTHGLNMEKPTETIMVGVDGSKHAEAAFQVATDMAKLHGARLLIVAIHTSPAMPLTPGVPGYPQILTSFPEYSPKVPKEVTDNMEPTLKEYEERAKKAGVKSVESKIVAVWNTVGGGLVTEAEREGVSLIVVGSRGLTGLKRTLLGSVADYVVKNAHCNVLVVRR